MTSLEFLEVKLKELSIQFPHIHIMYGYDEMIGSHIVELNPETEYYTNKKLDNAWIPISIEFMKLYESEDIAFISSDSTLRIENPLLDFKSHISVTNDIQAINNLFAPLTNRNMELALPDYIISPAEMEANLDIKKLNCPVIYNPIVKKQLKKERDNDYSYSLAA